MQQRGKDVDGGDARTPSCLEVTVRKVETLAEDVRLAHTLAMLLLCPGACTRQFAAAELVVRVAIPCTCERGARGG